MKWLPIKDLPVEYENTRKMFVVKGIDIPMDNGRKYQTDPYCVWFNPSDQTYVRWPHHFDPTHFIELP